MTDRDGAQSSSQARLCAVPPMLASVCRERGLKLDNHLGRRRLKGQPSSRTGENPPYGMIGGSRRRRHHSKPGPRLDPARPEGARQSWRWFDLVGMSGTSADLLARDQPLSDDGPRFRGGARVSKDHSRNRNGIWSWSACLSRGSVLSSCRPYRKAISGFARWRCY
jgi:hypothetical protein